MRILIVDDSESVRLLFEVWLKAAGYTDVLTAASAEQAFKHLAMDDPSRSDTGVDLILMDVAMPEMDGIDACRRIKAAPHLQEIPIIVVTAQEELSHLEDAFSAGATDFITESVKQVELLARVRSALTLKHAMDSYKRACLELENKNRALEEALDKVQVLSGSSPVRSS